MAIVPFLWMLVIACTVATPPPATPQPSPSASPAPSTSPSPSPGPSNHDGLVDGAAQAAALVLRSNARFAGVGPLQPDLIGQSAWYEAYRTDASDHEGFAVDVTIGWGDCMAGCISRHMWHHMVTSDGTISRPRESGDELPPDLPPPPDVSGTGAVDITVVAGPTCPVETDPPDPACAPRPVTNATVVVLDPDGREVATTHSDETGHARASDLPAGVYVVQGEADDGLMGGPTGETTVWALGPGPGTATLVYDTGIR